MNDFSFVHRQQLLKENHAILSSPACTWPCKLKERGLTLHPDGLKTYNVPALLTTVRLRERQVGPGSPCQPSFLRPFLNNGSGTKEEGSVMFQWKC